MLATGPQTYELIIDKPRYTVTGPHGHGFKPPASEPKRWKLYTISKGGKLLYVGIASRRMSARIRDGVTATGAHGYHGYKLDDGEYRLDVWAATHDVVQEDVERIEAEVAYYWRHHQGNWPEAQNEIHFHTTEQVHRDMAMRVIVALTSG